MHEPAAFLFPELAYGEAHYSQSGHDGAEQRVSCDKHVSVNVVVHAKIDTERDDDRIDDYAQRQIDGDITFVYVKSLFITHMLSIKTSKRLAG